MNLTTILIIVNVFAALTMIVLTLMQQSKGDMGSAFGGGGSQSMFGSRGSANFLSRATSIMCAVFFISSLTLAYIYSNRNASDSVINGSVIQESSQVPTVGDVIIPEVDTLDSSVPEVIEEASNEIPQVLEEAANDALESIPEVPAVTE